MNKQTRINKIAEVIRGDAYGRQDILWHDDLRSMDVFEIPLEYLVYNKYNGRILSRTKTLERQGRLIDPETADGKTQIEELLWESKTNRNAHTLIDIEKRGQIKVGIVTRDGIVIDGNRRLMLLNRLKTRRFFKAVVLPVSLEADPIEIEKLETVYQMGEDEKLGYNPIEKYLKTRQIYLKLRPAFSHVEAVAEIAKWMGEDKSDIEHWLGVMEIIDEYLTYLGYDGIYAMADTPGDGKEDLFLFVKKWMKTYSGSDGESAKGFDGYLQSDVDDLRNICFDYVRAKIGKSFDGKLFRNIADGQRKNHFFGDRRIWNSFSEAHFSEVSPIARNIDDITVDYDSDNIIASLSSRDIEFRNEAREKLVRNIEEHLSDLNNAKAADQPLELVNRARKAIDSIHQGNKAVRTPEVVRQMEELVENVTGILGRKSIEETLRLVIHMLGSVDLVGTSYDRDVAFERIKEISRLSYRMEKEING